MKRLMMHSMFAAAVVTALAASGSAQVLTAEIPFAFHANGVVAPAGRYEIKTDVSTAATIIRLYNVDFKQPTMVTNYSLSDPSKAWRSAGVPKLAFECAGQRCALREIWTGRDVSYRIAGPKLGADEPVQVTEIRLTHAVAP